MLEKNNQMQFEVGKFTVLYYFSHNRPLGATGAISSRLKCKFS